MKKIKNNKNETKKKSRVSKSKKTNGMKEMMNNEKSNKMMEEMMNNEKNMMEEMMDNKMMNMMKEMMSNGKGMEEMMDNKMMNMMKEMMNNKKSNKMMNMMKEKKKKSNKMMNMMKEKKKKMPKINRTFDLLEPIGILDPKGLNINPLTNNPYENLYKDAPTFPNTYAGYAEKWSSFPVYEHRNEFIKAIASHQVILMDSGTGSGKTVIMPKLALHALKYEGNVVVTIPKQLIVVSAAEYAARTLDVNLGEEVGYSHRRQKMRSNKTRLLYTTDGSITTKLMIDPSLKGIDILIIDEAHERNVQIDFLLLLVKETLRLRPDFKLIIMSATIDIKKFEDYYKEFSFIHLYGGEATPYPIKDVFIERPLKLQRNFIQDAVDKIYDILTHHDDGDILVFVTSGNEGARGCKLLAEKTRNGIINGTIKPYCTKLYAGLRKDDENLALSKNAYKDLSVMNGVPYNRKVVFSTNVAESSLTVDGVKFVIDSGLELKESYNFKGDYRQLNNDWITNAQRMQRRGRAGRTGPGECYYLYTKKQCDEMKKFPDPPVLTSNLSDELLRLLNSDFIGNVKDLIDFLNKLMDQIPKENLDAMLKKLLQLGFIEQQQKTFVLSELGKETNKYNKYLSPTLAKFYIYCNELGYKYEGAEVANLLERLGGKLGEIIIPMPKYFEYDKEEKKKYENAIKTFSNNLGDVITALRVYKEYRSKMMDKEMSKKEIEKYFKEKFIKFMTLSSLDRQIYQFKRDFIFEKRNIPNMPLMNNENININNNMENNQEGGEPQLKYLSQEEYNDLKSIKFEEALLYLLLKADNTNLAYQRGGKKYMTIYPQEMTYGEISKESILQQYSQMSKYIIYQELMSLNNIISFNVVSKLSRTIMDLFEKYQKDISKIYENKIKSFKKSSNSEKSYKSDKFHKRR
jgi:ATP-dependent RNA helicase DHX8/PRP22